MLLKGFFLLARAPQLYSGNGAKSNYLHYRFKEE